MSMAYIYVYKTIWMLLHKAQPKNIYKSLNMSSKAKNSNVQPNGAARSCGMQPLTSIYAKKDVYKCKGIYL